MPKLVRNQLTAKQVEKAGPGKYADGGGLYLVVSEGSGKSWVWRGSVHGKRKELGIGSANRDNTGKPIVSLDAARETAWTFTRWARSGVDPEVERRREQSIGLTFEEATRKTWESQIKPQVRRPKQALLWINMMTTYAFPKLGKMRLADIRQSDVKDVLAPIWQHKEETARRVKQRISVVFNWARTGGHFDGINPTEGVEDGLPKQSGKIEHFTALPYTDAPALMRRLETAEGVGPVALRFLILTATRTGSIRVARWRDIDEAEAVWTVPPDGDKMERGFRVPLSMGALDALRAVKGLSDDLVFPGIKRGKPLSDNTLTRVLKRLDVDATVHGMRSCFRDWAEDQTDYRHEIKEAALAHKVSNAVERAYRRTDLFDARRALMNDWAKYLGVSNV